MTLLTRRQWSALALSAAASALPLQATAQPAERRLPLLLNTGLSGPLAFFILAEERGYFRDAGLAVDLQGGPGAAAMVSLVRDGQVEAGYGDSSALIERIARSAPGTAPVAVWTGFNRTPFTIAVPANGPIRVPRDLEGKRITGHAGDAALLTFDLYARAAGIAAATVRVDAGMGSMGQATADMLRGTGADGVFGFVNTIVALAAPFGVDGRRQLRFLNWSDVLPDWYGNTLFVTRSLLQRDPAAVRALVHGVNRGLADTVRDPQAAIDALLRRAPGSDRSIQLDRLQGTLAIEMAHPEGARIGVGDMDDARLARAIAQIVEGKRLPRMPGLREVFDRAFLPPLQDRVRSLAG